MSANADLAPPEERPKAALAAVQAGRIGIERVRDAADGCRACDLWERATQTVFGRGPVPARLMLVGEQPGDQEDRAGEPFVGPAGQVLDRALADAGIDREKVFVTNVVKHFKWRPSPGSKRRLHERPTRAEVGACIPWVESELRLVKPEAVVALGATAAQALLRSDISINRDRGRPLESDLAPLVVATFHPSAVLRADPQQRERTFSALVHDLAFVNRELES
jgi:uracil-DNA glycosylase family protein